MRHLLISDFNISGDPIPNHVANMIYTYHQYPLNRINECTSLDVFPSFDTPGQPSAWRPRWWEKQRGRSGSSQHCFGEQEDGTFDIENGKGACDITCDDFQKNKWDLVKALLDYSTYTRLAVYNTFVHADYKHKGSGTQIFESGSDSKWKFLEVR